MAPAVAKPAQVSPQASAVAPPLQLETGWALQSSAKVTAPGSTLSTPGFSPKGWHKVSVPSTVVAALVKNKVYPDPYFGMNIRQIPGTSYKVATNFSNEDMAADNPFAVAWWYRKAFAIPAGWRGKTIWLKFEALNFRANVWLNGEKLADAKTIAGSWRIFELDATRLAKPGGNNVLAVEVFPQQKRDLGITFVDWNPTPPDKNLGLWRTVSLRATGPVALRAPAVLATVNSPANDAASLTVTAVLQSASDQPVNGILRGRIPGAGANNEAISFEQPVTVPPQQSKDVVFDAGKFPQLLLKSPRLWWPAQMKALGTPHLYDLELEFVVGDQIADRSRRPFGVREVKAEFDDKKRRLFTINGHKILIRGGGWSSDMMMREDPRRQHDELSYVLDMGLNTVRLEGKLENQHFLDYADRNGILIMAGWCCCDHWEDWKKWTPDDHFIAAESTRDQLYRLRAHPSVITWMNASDMPPPAAVERKYLEVAAAVRWPNPVISSAADKKAEHSGPSGVKMNGPYEWVPPRYWFEDTKKGGAFGFNTETSPGPAVPPIESLRRMLPPDKLWPINEHWDFHAGGNEFSNILIHTAALEARYGKASSAEDYAYKSQLMAYEGIRAMFEAFTRNKYTSTGLIQWMLNNAWPGIIWHLYDHYLQPGGGYFGAKVGNQPLHPIYSPHDGSIWVVNSTYQAQAGLKLSAKIFNLDMTEKFSREVPVDLPADGTKNLFVLPAAPPGSDGGLTPTYFIDLRLTDAAGKLVGQNFYWASTTAETLAYDKTKWFVTPTKTYADFTALANLPKVTLRSQSVSSRQGKDASTRVTLSNPSPSLAFFVRLKLTRGKGGDEVLPVRWSDNYVSLLPGETRELTAMYRVDDLGGKTPVVELSGGNVAARSPAAKTAVLDEKK